jgi:hypothetical protein
MAADWNELRVRYICGNQSLKALAEEAKVSYSQMCKKASAEKWTRQRKEFGRKAQEKALARAGARAQANIERAIFTAEGLLKEAQEGVKDEDQFRRYLVTRANGNDSETVEEVFRKLDTKAMKELGDVAQAMITLLRELYQAPLEKDELRKDAEIRRLEAEAERIRKETEKLRLQNEELKLKNEILKKQLDTMGRDAAAQHQEYVIEILKGDEDDAEDPGAGTQ